LHPGNEKTVHGNALVSLPSPLKRFRGSDWLAVQADGEASLGRYVAGSCVGAAAAYDLFIKNHAY